MSLETSLRLPCESIPEQCLLVYKYLTPDLLSLVREGILIEMTKRILKACVRGIAVTYDRNVVHLGILNRAYICVAETAELTMLRYQAGQCHDSLLPKWSGHRS